MRRSLLITLLLALALSGCTDIAHTYQRTVWGIDCRPEKAVNGHCVAATEKGTK